MPVSAPTKDIQHMATYQEDTEQAKRLAHVQALAAHVWSSDGDAHAFLTTPHPLLQGQRPLDVPQTEEGAFRVETLLWQLYHGIAA